jgi:hypothetical protein
VGPKGWASRTYLPFLLVDEILVLLPAAEEQDSLANNLAVASHLGALLDETSERRDTGTGADHDDRLRRVGRQLEV